MMSHPQAHTDPQYKAEDVEALMTAAAQALGALERGSICLGGDVTEHVQVCATFDAMEFAIDALRKSVLENVTRRISPDPVRVNAAVELPLPSDVDVKVVAVVCNEAFQDMCGHYKQTPAQVIAGFVADACGIDDASIGYCTGGSDERDQASAYVERRFGWVVGFDLASGPDMSPTFHVR